jgi:hypothetical protein
MKEPQRIKLNPETPKPKEPIKRPLLPLNKAEWDVTGQDNDDTYTTLDLDKVNKLLNEISDEDNSKNN